MSTILRLLPALLLLLLARSRGRPAAPRSTPASTGDARRVGGEGDVPEGFVPHAWADRADADEGRL